VHNILLETGYIEQPFSRLGSYSNSKGMDFKYFFQINDSHVACMFVFLHPREQNFSQKQPVYDN